MDDKQRFFQLLHTCFGTQFLDKGHAGDSDARQQKQYYDHRNYLHRPLVSAAMSFTQFIGFSFYLFFYMFYFFSKFVFFHFVSPFLSDMSATLSY